MYNAQMVAENFGKTGTALFLTGVAYDDLNKNQFYTPGEGRGGIKVEATSIGKASPVTLTDTTGSAGGYEIAAAPGTYKVTFSGGGLAAPVVQTVTLGTQNVKVDLIDPAKLAPVETSNAADVKGASGEALQADADLLNLLRTEASKLDFTSLTKHPDDPTQLPQIWADALHPGVEMLKDMNAEIPADDLAGLIKLLGVPHIDADGHLLNA